MELIVGRPKALEISLKLHSLKGLLASGELLVLLMLDLEGTTYKIIMLGYYPESIRGKS